jgi:SAM-dependent methyltransferase
MASRGLAVRRRRLERWLRSRSLTHTLSLARFNLRERVTEVVPAYVKGRVLEIGAGLSPYEDLLSAAADEVTRADIEDRSGEVDVVADVQDMRSIPSESFETVVCTQVLEHVPSPGQAMSEIARVLVTGGHAVITVPHLSAIHEAPNDFYRYTRYSLETMAREAGLTVSVLEESGGLISFVAHGASVAFLTLAAAIPPLIRPAWAINYVLGIRLAALVDRVIGMRRRYPCDYTLVAAKVAA